MNVHRQKTQRQRLNFLHPELLCFNSLHPAARRRCFRARPNQLFIHTKSSAMLHDNILIGYEQ